ncbi:MAG: cupin domain-containing protein, partial [Chloroflexota bacterium]
LAQADEMSLRAVACLGTTPWHKHAQHDELLWLREGVLAIELREGSLRLERDELTVIPRDTVHRLSAQDRAVAIALMDSHVPPHAQMGLMGDTGLGEE